jgi:putative ABC transport system permease protein
MHGLSKDVQYATRTLWKRPLFTTVAVVTLALGIGANTAIFSVVNSVLLRPLSLPESDRLVTFWHSAPAKGLSEVNLNDAMFAYYRARTQSFEKIAAFEDGGLVMTGAGEAESLPSASVTFNYFEVLGRQPLLGRTFLKEEDTPGNNHVVMLSYGVWQRKFGGQTSVLGQSIKLDDVPMSIVGVMPADFDFPDPAERNSDHIELWVPKGLNPQDTNSWNLSTVGRLKPNVPPVDAQREIAGLYEGFAHDYGAQLGEGALGNGVITVLMPLQQRIVGDVRTPLLLLLGAIGLVLLIACANLANLLLASAVSRRRELALRHCLGASTTRIARQALIESSMLAFAGALVGLLFATWVLAGLRGLALTRVPHLELVSIDATVLLFTAGLAVATALVCGLVPAFRSAKVNVQDAIKDGGRGTESAASRGIKNAFVVSQLALSLVLLIGAALLLQSFKNLLSVNPGFRAQNVLMASISLPSTRYTKTQSKVFYESLLERLRSLPGVQFAEMCNVIPFSGDGQGGPFVVEGREPTAGQSSKVAWLRTTTPGYFSAMGMPVLKGRSFQSQDTENSLPVAIVDETLARTNWPNDDPLGKRLRIGSSSWMTIVGVVPNVKNRKLDEESKPYIYRPYTQWLRSEARLIVRTSDDPNSIVPAMRQQLAGLDPELPLSDVSTIEEAMARSVATTRLTNWLLTSFAIIALLLAMIGIYGVMSINVIGRTNEFGIRMALGAQTSSVLKIVLGQGLRLALLGVAFGIPAAIGLTRLMQGLLFGIGATDSRTLLAISALLVVIALLACYLPARRATKVDPLVALRYE